MKADERIVIHARENVVTLTGMWETKLKFLGSSCPGSVHPGNVVSSLTLVLEEEVTVVAVETQRPIQTGKYQNTECGYFLFQVTKEGEILDPFVPKPDRVGQIVPEVGLTVRIGDEFFLSPLLISDYRVEEKMAKLFAKYRNVGEANANLLCRFMAGRAEADDIRKVAEELVVQTVDVPMLQKKLADAGQRMKELNEERLQLQSSFLVENGVRGSMQAQVAELEAERVRLSHGLRDSHLARCAEVAEIGKDLARVTRLYESLVVSVQGLIHAPAENFWAGRAAHRIKLIDKLVQAHQEQKNGQPK